MADCVANRRDVFTLYVSTYPFDIRCMEPDCNDGHYTLDFDSLEEAKRVMYAIDLAGIWRANFKADSVFLHLGIGLDLYAEGGDGDCIDWIDYDFSDFLREETGGLINF